MSDLATSVTFTTGETVTAAIMNSIIPSAVIQASFVSGKPIVSTLANNDSVLSYNASGNSLQQILYSSLQAQIVSGSISASQGSQYNLVMNGDGLIAQRNTSFASIAASSYTLDRWKWIYAGSASRVTVAQDVPTTAATLPFVSGQPSSYSDYKITVPSATSTINATDVQYLDQFIENNIIEPILNGPISVSFIYKTNFTGTISFFVRDNGSAHSYVVPISVTGDSTWRLVQIQNITGLASQTLSLGSYGSSTCDMGLTFLAGSTFQTGTTGSWVAGNFVAANTQGNFCASTSNVFQLAQFMVNPGATCVPYFSEPFTTQLLKCSRYYTKNYPYTISPGTGSPGSYASFITRSAALADGHAPYPTVMRSQPTTTLYTYSTGAANSAILDISSGTNIGSAAGISVASSQGIGSISFTSGGTAGHAVALLYSSDADY